MVGPCPAQRIWGAAKGVESGPAQSKGAKEWRRAGWAESRMRERRCREALGGWSEGRSKGVKEQRRVGWVECGARKQESKGWAERGAEECWVGGVWSEGAGVQKNGGEAGGWSEGAWREGGMEQMDKGGNQQVNGGRDAQMGGWGNGWASAGVSGRTAV